jgi:hypothetical protein
MNSKFSTYAKFSVVFIIIILFYFQPNKVFAQSCNHTIRLTDTFGDGWNSGTVTVSVNGVPVLTNITLAAGSGPEDHLFSASTGDVINITRTADGIYPSEMRVQVIGGSANTILPTQEPVNTPGTNVIACCTPTIPGLATYSSPGNGSTGANTCGVALSWSAPANTGCNAATSYDVYFGTSATPPLVTNTTSTTYNTGTLSASTTYYWKIVPKNSTGGAVGSLTWSFTTGATVCTACTHTIRLTDTFGDGWNGGTITVTVNGVPVLTNIALAGTTGPEDFTFAAPDGAVINVTRTNDGSFPSEMRVEILATAGIVILPTQQPLTAPGTNVSGCCSPVAPSCATNPVPANGASAINPCSAIISWTAPAISGCNAATSYDIYFGTTAVPPLLANHTGTSYSLTFGLSDNTTYYWKIVPRNGIGTAAGCPTWSFTTGTSPNPSYCLFGNAVNYPAGGTNCAQLTSASSTQNGCAWNRNQISFASAFDYSVQMYFGASAGGADGCAFVFQNSPQGISQCGSNGGQLGAGGISNAVVVEFDTYDNDFPAHIFDIAADHTAIEIDGNMQGPGAPLCGPVQADPLDGLLADGLMHMLRVTWNPATMILSVYVDGSLRIACNYDFVNNVFGGDPNVWWGFTGSTGLLANQQYFCPITIPVPVELLEYSVDCSDGKPLLTWYTASETNSNYFTIERSADGLNYESLATIAAAGYSNTAVMYQFYDESPLEGDGFYRLIQTDYDGSISDLGNRPSKCNAYVGHLSILKVTKSDNSLMSVQFDTPLKGNHAIQIYDISGRILFDQTVACLTGFNEVWVNQLLQSGVYFISITNSTEKKTTKFHL